MFYQNVFLLSQVQGLKGHCLAAWDQSAIVWDSIGER